VPAVNDVDGQIRQSLHGGDVIGNIGAGQFVGGAGTGSCARGSYPACGIALVLAEAQDIHADAMRTRIGDSAPMCARC